MPLQRRTNRSNTWSEPCNIVISACFHCLQQLVLPKPSSRKFHFASVRKPSGRSPHSASDVIRSLPTFVRPPPQILGCGAAIPKASRRHSAASRPAAEFQKYCIASRSSASKPQATPGQQARLNKQGGGKPSLARWSAMQRRRRRLPKRLATRCARLSASQACCSRPHRCP